jgi:hypothetical protein
MSRMFEDMEPKRDPSMEAMVEVVWMLASKCEPVELQDACDQLSQLPLMEVEGIPHLVEVLRQEAGPAAVRRPGPSGLGVHPSNRVPAEHQR